MKRALSAADQAELTAAIERTNARLAELNAERERLAQQLWEIDKRIEHLNAPHPQPARGVRYVPGDE